MQTQAFTFQQFDSDIFGCPYFRLDSTNPEEIKAGFSILAKDKDWIADAKIDSTNKSLNLCLQQLGFRKVCTQIQLIFYLNNKISPVNNVLIQKSVILTDALIDKHVHNFTYDRFTLDFQMPIDKRNLLYERWIRNSLNNFEYPKAVQGANFISTKKFNESLKLDLSSVLEHGKGIGSNLLSALKNYAQNQGLKKLTVITECENINAVKFYIANGFEVDQFLTCFHYTAK